VDEDGEVHRDTAALGKGTPDYSHLLTARYCKLDGSPPLEGNEITRVCDGLWPGLWPRHPSANYRYEQAKTP